MIYNEVMVHRSTLARLSEIAEDQWGLVTRRQAHNAGVSRATFQRLASGGVLDRVARGVYRLSGSPVPDQLELRAAWLQLAPDVPAWRRSVDEGVVSHRSAANVYGLGHLPADTHEFTMASRRQSRRPDVRLHRRQLRDGEWISFRGLPVTRPSRIASDLLFANEDPEAVGHVIADAIRGGYDYPGSFAASLAPHAARFGLRRNSGINLLSWLLALVDDPDTDRWLEEARGHSARVELAEREDLLRSPAEEGRDR